MSREGDGGEEGRGGEREREKREGNRQQIEKERKKEMRGGKGLLKGNRECPQVMLLLARAESISCQKSKGSTVQMPEY